MKNQTKKQDSSKSAKTQGSAADSRKAKVSSRDQQIDQDEE